MKTYLKFLAGLLLTAILWSCSDDDSKKNDNNGNNPSAGVTFDGQRLTFVDVTVSEGANSLLETILTTQNGVSIILYLKKGDNDLQDAADPATTYNADGGEYNTANYPDMTVRGYVNTVDGLYNLRSGSVKVKLNDSGTHDFTFSNVQTQNADAEAVLNGQAAVEEGVW